MFKHINSPPPPPLPPPPSIHTPHESPGPQPSSTNDTAESNELTRIHAAAAMEPRRPLQIQMATTNAPFAKIMLSDQDKSIRDVKRKLQDTHNIPRFRLRLIEKDQCLKDEDTIPHDTDLKVVLLSYIDATQSTVNELMDTVISGTSTELECILQRPQHPDSIIEHLHQCRSCGTTTIGALEAAVLQRHLPKVRLLLEAQADLQKPGNNMALLAAVDCGFRDITHLLLKTRANPNIPSGDGSGVTSLWLAACKGDWHIMRSLLKARAYVNAADFRGTTPLHLACEQSDIPPVLELLKHRADPEARNLDGETPIVTAFWWNQFDVLKAMRHHFGWKTKPNIRNSDTDP